MKAQFINTEVRIVRDMEVDADWEAVEPPEDGKVWNDSAGKTTLNEMVAFELEMWRARDGYTHKDHHAESDALEAALRAAADKLYAAKGPFEKLTIAARNPEVQARQKAEDEHFEKYGNGPITEEVYNALPEHTKMLYEKPE